MIIHVQLLLYWLLCQFNIVRPYISWKILAHVMIILSDPWQILAHINDHCQSYTVWPYITWQILALVATIAVSLLYCLTIHTLTNSSPCCNDCCVNLILSGVSWCPEKYFSTTRVCKTRNCNKQLIIVL